MAPGEIVYGTRLLHASAIHDRVARNIQSQAATALAEALSQTTTNPALISKSHSRTLVAAAVGNAGVLALGIDAEWMAPNRPFSSIIRSFAPSLPSAIEAGTFYRLWTFLEAFYKAFQRWPEEDDIIQVFDRPNCGDAWQTARGTQLLQHQRADAFTLTIVWKCSGLCMVHEMQARA